jgi:phosphoglycerol transferase MdoB-like AlkP superfamily enzyme
MFSKFISDVKENLKLQTPRANMTIWLWTGILLECFIETVGRGSLFGTVLFLFQKPALFALNTLIILAVLSLAFVFRRRLLALLFFSILWIAIGITNGVLLLFRTTPFTAQDLLLIKYAIGLGYDYLGVLGISLLVAGILLVLVGLVLIYKKAPKLTEKIPRLKNFSFILLNFFVILLLNECGTVMGLLPTSYGNIGEAYEDYGMVYCFSNTLFNTGIKEPEDYDDTLVDDDVIKEVIKDPEEEKQGPNIIVVQLESFFDITEVKGLELSKDPIPYFHILSENFSSGYLSMPSVGAGTANSEFEVLTGMNMDSFGPGEYPYKTILQTKTCESAAYNLAELGYSTYAIHNNEGTFYDRNSVFPRLGFSCFVPIEYMYDLTYTETGWAEDRCLTDYISQIITEQDAPAFVYTISVQGHGAYPHEDVLDNPEVEVLSLENEDLYEAYRYYVNQIYEMDQFLKELVSSLENSGEDCVLVLFGDHLPSLELTEEDLEDGDLYLTKYVIWDNLGLSKDDQNLEAYQLMASVCNRLDQHQGILCRYHQLYLDGEVDEDTYLEKLQTLEYDMLYGDQLVYDGENPYAEQEMTLGLDDISISEITYNLNP